MDLECFALTEIELYSMKAVGDSLVGMVEDEIVALAVKRNRQSSD